MKLSPIYAARCAQSVLIISSLAFVSACGDESDGASSEDKHEEHEECGGHGHLHGDHCDCDSGYVQSPDDEASCVEQVDEGEEADGNGMGGSTSEIPELSPCDIQGNLDADEIPSSGSVAFVIVDGSYRFIKQPGMTDTSISFIDSTCEHAYGWSRDKPIADDSAVETSWVLDLATMEFQAIEIPDTSWVVLRNGRDDGTVVGKLAIDSGTPDDRSDDVSRGFVHDLVTGETELVARDGYSDIGFTGINDAGVIVGFNDFGTVGYVYEDGVFTDLIHDDAFRLFPFQITSSNVIVGFWGHEEATWYDNAINAGFVAESVDGAWSAKAFNLDGQSGTGLTGMNASGRVTGLAYASPTSLPTVFGAADAESSPVLHYLNGDLSPFPTGISATGAIFGQIFILEEPAVCGGHGVLNDDLCTCDEGYELDAYDDLNCLAPGAECSGHGHLHGDECHCDTGFKKSSEDASECIPS